MSSLVNCYQDAVVVSYQTIWDLVSCYQDLIVAAYYTTWCCLVVTHQTIHIVW